VSVTHSDRTAHLKHLQFAGRIDLLLCGGPRFHFSELFQIGFRVEVKLGVRHHDAGDHLGANAKDLLGASMTAQAKQVRKQPLRKDRRHPERASIASGRDPVGLLALG
jgi:hypothetical protein